MRSFLSFFLVSGSLVGVATADDAPSGLAPQNTDAFRIGPQANSTSVTPDVSTTPPLAKKENWFDRMFNQQLPFKFGIIAAETASDNIFYQPKKTYDYITEISPFVILTLGNPVNLSPTLDQETNDIRSDSGNLNYLQITARPIITLYERNTDLDIVDEYEDGIYSHQFGKLALSIEQKYEKLSQPTIENTAADTNINRDIFTTTARASYIYSDKLSTYATATQTISKYKTEFYTNSNEWTGDFYFLYQLFPKLSLGAGPRVGWVDIAREPNQTYQSLLAHAIYPASGKLSFALSVGGELREYEDHSAADQVTPIVEGEAVYKPFDSMTLTLEANRHRIVSNSQPGQDYTNSSVTFTGRQRFLQVVYFTLTGGYLEDQYSGSGTVGIGPVREDKYFFVKGGIEWTSKDWLTIDGDYQYSKDDSTLEAYNFNENRFTVSATLKY